jgi:hypothetical protein
MRCYVPYYYGTEIDNSFVPKVPGNFFVSAHEVKLKVIVTIDCTRNSGGAIRTRVGIIGGGKECQARGRTGRPRVAHVHVRRILLGQVAVDLRVRRELGAVGRPRRGPTQVRPGKGPGGRRMTFPSTHLSDP